MLVLKDTRTHQPKLQIKLEIDTNPPEGSDYELKYLDFPTIQRSNTNSIQFICK